MKSIWRFAVIMPIWHEKMGTYILEQAHHAAKTGEPIIRHMEYAFPHQGFVDCKDQFMLGDKYLIAPVLTKEHTRRVMLPKGVWIDGYRQKVQGAENDRSDGSSGTPALVRKSKISG